MLESVLGEIRARHAGAGLEDAVRAGQLTEAEAGELKHRIRGGDHPRGLRRLLRHGTSRSEQEREE